MNYNKIFDLAKEKGLESFELDIRRNSELSITVFHGEVEKFQESDVTVLSARGIYQGKIGCASTEDLGSGCAEYLVSKVMENAGILDDTTEIGLFAGSPAYKSVRYFNRDLAGLPLEEKIFRLKETEQACHHESDLVHEVEVSYSEIVEEITLMNSLGLNLKTKSNAYTVFCEIVCGEGEEVKTNFEFILDNDYSKFVPQELAKKAVLGAVSKLGGSSCESQNMPCVLSSKVVSSLLRPYLTNLYAEDVQKHSSVLEGKLGQKVASSKVTILEEPLYRNPFCRFFDDEGVATSNKTIISRGVLQTYFYNRETAKKDGVESTGNGYSHGGKMGIGFTNIVLKPGSKSEEELFESVQNGIYIDDLQGLHAGMNPHSGNFSLQAAGYLIKDGKKDRPVCLITVAGNLFELFKDVVAVGNNSTLTLSSIICPSIQLKSIAVSGK